MHEKRVNPIVVNAVRVVALANVEADITEPGFFEVRIPRQRRRI